jgi:hypothetical protein
MPQNNEGDWDTYVTREGSKLRGNKVVRNVHSRGAPLIKNQEPHAFATYSKSPLHKSFFGKIAHVQLQ